MDAGGIDASRITSMLEKLKATAQGKSEARVEKPSGLHPKQGHTGVSGSSQVSFSDALKNSLDKVNKMQVDAEQLGKDFVLGKDGVGLSDVMIEGQKAAIGFQATVQVRNKLVSAYQDIMNMQV